MKSILVLSGDAAFADPWHDMASTSHEVASILAAPDVATTVRSTSHVELAEIAETDLVVVNTSLARFNEPAGGDSDLLIDAVVARAKAVRPVLALHQTLITASGYPELAAAIGAHWVDGVSNHPDLGQMTLTLDGENPALEGLGDVSAFDERYRDLALQPGLEVLGTVSVDGSTYPACWFILGAPVAFSALGHDHRSYASNTHQMLLKRLATRLLSLA